MTNNFSCYMQMMYGMCIIHYVYNFLEIIARNYGVFNKIIASKRHYFQIDKRNYFIQSSTFFNQVFQKIHRFLLHLLLKIFQCNHRQYQKCHFLYYTTYHEVRCNLQFLKNFSSMSVNPLSVHNFLKRQYRKYFVKKMLISTL